MIEHPYSTSDKSLSPSQESLIFCPTSSFQQKALEEFKKYSPLRTGSPIADAITLWESHNLAIVGPAIGQPAAKIACERHIKNGARRLIIFGSCGAGLSTKQEVSIGDIVIPSSVTSCVSQATIDLPPVKLSQELEERLSVVGHKVRQGRVCTSDSPITENTPQTLGTLEDAVFFDMELFALAEMCKSNNCELTALLIVSDIFVPPHNSTNEFLGAVRQSGFKSKIFKSSLRSASQILAQALAQTKTL